MRSKPIHIIFLVLIIIPFLKGQNNTFKDLEKRVEQLEGKVFDLERRSIDTLIESRWHKLKKNMKKKRCAVYVWIARQGRKICLWW